MLWHHPQPLHPRILHRHRVIQPLGHRLGDEGLPLLLEQLDEAGFLGNQGVDAGRFAVEIVRYVLLYGKRWNNNVNLTKEMPLNLSLNISNTL